MTKRYKLDYESPIGIVEIVGSAEGIRSIMFSEQDKIVHVKQVDTPQVLVDCMEQLHEYFQGERFSFAIPYNFEGTDFQKAVWHALTTMLTLKQGLINRLQ